MNSAVPTEYPRTAATTGGGMNESFVGSGSGSRMDPRRIGAFAAIALGVLQLLSTIFGIAVRAPIPNDVDPGRDLAKVTANAVLMSGQGTLRALAALSLIILALAVAQWLQAAAPFAMRVATSAAVIGGALFIMDNVGRLASYGALAEIDGKDHSAAVAAYSALIVVSLLHETAGFIMLGVFVLTSAVVVARSRAVSRPLWSVGIVFGVALIGAHVTGLPSLAHLTGFSYVPLALGLVMGPLLIIWPIWLGVELLRGRPTSVAALGATTTAPA